VNILFVALEESGKKISNTILKKLNNQNLKHNYFSFGLDQQVTFNIKELNEIKIKPIMGFFQVVRNLKYIYNLRKYMISLVEKFNIDHIFFIDSFDYSRFFYKKFNRIKFSQIVGPSVFIWKKNKAKFINDNFENIFSIFLADRKYYNPNIYSYIGHPLSSNVISKNTKIQSIKNVGIFLGSRDQEVFNNLKTISNFINNSPNYNYFFFTLPKYEKHIKNYFFGNSKVFIYLNDNDYYSNISKLDFAIACSGTVHLELSLSYIPHLIFYKTNFLNILFFKFFIKTKFISLLNIFANKEIIKEFLQNSSNSNSIKIYIESINNKKDLDKITVDLKKNVKKFNINYFNLNPIIDYLKKFS
jgi:lipid-A-disaccharide synthase